MESAVAFAWNEPDAFCQRGDRREVRKIVHGVMIEVQVYGDELEVFRAAFPKTGAGVVKNVGGGQVKSMDLDRSALEEEGWTRAQR
ncbi:hypothetical protein GA0111570_102130 [Raineyella antarctica]|uniref:Uncharacterized protein n=1 Tax=Raineyella antarctica TaxID=1577474 RepID=A0A1G6GEB8_9ACTN|nr:hypothetical protein [Raineyella antarctica]SDB80341.1 hypothetical protein GA0111570_102130 [Raineyella antarctica]